MIRTAKYILLENSRYLDLLDKASGNSHTSDSHVTDTQPSDHVMDDQTSNGDGASLRQNDNQETSGTMEGREPLTSESILKYIAKNQKLKAQSILFHLQSINELKWNDKGNIIVSSQIIPHSQIIDIVKYCVNPKSSFKPVGWDYIIDLIKDSCIPLSVITNNKVREEILQSHRNSLTDQIGGSNIIKNTSPTPGISQKVFKEKYLKLKTASSKTSDNIKQHSKSNKPKFKWQTL